MLLRRTPFALERKSYPWACGRQREEICARVRIMPWATPWGEYMATRDATTFRFAVHVRDPAVIQCNKLALHCGRITYAVIQGVWIQTLVELRELHKRVLYYAANNCNNYSLTWIHNINFTTVTIDKAKKGICTIWSRIKGIVCFSNFCCDI